MRRDGRGPHPRKFPAPWPALGGLALFLGTAALVTAGLTQRMDSRVMAYFDAHRTVGLLTLMQGVSLIGSGWMLTVAALGSVYALAAFPRGRPDAGRVLIAIGGGEGIINGLKFLFHRPRPSPVFAPLGYSFPSGHSFFAVTIYGLFAWRLTRRDPSRWGGVWLLAGMLMAAIGFSRVYVGVHYPSDVLAGLALGLSWLWVCLALPLSRRRQPPQEKTW